jgi:ABC-2 type transport system ATP-binding protein
LGIAASLLADPPLLLWDEPTAGLDPAARRFTLDLIREMGKTRTVVVATHILSDIDQICDHVGVMHEGKMIFSGPMREMKQRLKRDDAVTLELDGHSEDKARLVEQINEMDGIAAAMRDPHRLVVEMADGRARADALTDVMKMIDSSNVTLQAIHSGQNETEYAYLQLLQEDSAHGFQRFDIDARHEDDAIHGDSSS